MTTKSIARWVAIGALFIIPFLSLYVADGQIIPSAGMYFPFITGKNFAFRILVEIAFGAWLVLAICDKRYRPRLSWTLISLKLMVVWMLIADILAVNAHKALWSNYERMDGWVTLIHLYVFMVVLTAVLSANNLWRKWWLAFVAGSGLVTLYGLAQMIGLTAIHQGSTRIDSTLGNAEYLAGYLLFAIAIALWQAFETRNKEQAWLKWLLFALAAVELVVLFATGTRGTLIALVAAGVVGSVLWMFEAGKQGRRGAAAIFVVLIILVGGLFALRDTSFVQQSPNLERLASVFSLKDALGPRITIWEMAVEGVKAKPLHGWGQEGYNYVFNSYYHPSLYSQEPWFDRAHNVFLDWLIAGGVPALLFFLATLIFAVIALYRAPVSRPERILLLSAVAGYAVQGLVVFDNLFTYMPIIAIIGMAHLASSRPIGFLERAPEVNDTKLDTLVAPAAVVVVALLIWFVNVPGARAASDLIQGLVPSNSVDTRFAAFKSAVDTGGFAHQEVTEQIINFAGQEVADNSLPVEKRQEIAVYANEQMKAELLRAPQDARLHLQYALFLRGVGQASDAQAQSAIAHTLSPNKQSILLEQGIEAFQLNQLSEAVGYFTQAYKLDTDNKEPVAYIAAAHIAGNDVSGAKSLLQQVYGTTTVNHPILMLAYYQIKDWNDLVLTLKAKLAQSDDATTGFQIAAAYAQAGNLEAARNQVRATIVKHPDAQAQGEALLQQLGVSQ